MNHYDGSLEVFNLEVIFQHVQAITGYTDNLSTQVSKPYQTCHCQKFSPFGMLLCDLLTASVALNRHNIFFIIYRFGNVQFIGTKLKQKHSLWKLIHVGSSYIGHVQHSIYRFLAQTASNTCQTQTFLSKHRVVDSHRATIIRGLWSLPQKSRLFWLELLLSCHVETWLIQTGI